jgi:hypothetical protein
MPADDQKDDLWSLDGYDTLLLLLAAPGPHGADPGIGGITKLTKLLFLAREEAGFEGDENFEFTPYKYGPFSRNLYGALRTQRDAGLIEIRQSSSPDFVLSQEVQDMDDPEVQSAVRTLAGGNGGPPNQWLFRLTPKGSRMAHELQRRMPEERWRKLTRLKERYARMPLNELLTYVYQRYPSWAEKSVLPLAKSGS